MLTLAAAPCCREGYGLVLLAKVKGDRLSPWDSGTVSTGGKAQSVNLQNCLVRKEELLCSPNLLLQLSLESETQQWGEQCGDETQHLMYTPPSYFSISLIKRWSLAPLANLAGPVLGPQADSSQHKGVA